MTGLCLAILQILSICEILKLDTPIDFVNPRSTSSSIAYNKQKNFKKDGNAMFSQMYFIDQYTCNNHFKYHFLLTYCQQKLVNKFLQLSFIQCDHVPFELGR